jgi:ATP-dependent exoDNAse (exonuclease V) alpha subunit
LKLANRELGTVEGIGQDGRMSLKIDGGRPEDRVVELYPATHPRLDHGCAVTSHSSQGQIADRVLIYVDTELGAKDLLNNRIAYVAVSRGTYDAQIFTNDREKLRKRWAMTFRTRAPIFRSESRRSLRSPRLRSRRRVKAWTLD